MKNEKTKHLVKFLNAEWHIIYKILICSFRYIILRWQICILSVLYNRVSCTVIKWWISKPAVKLTRILHYGVVIWLTMIKTILNTIYTTNWLLLKKNLIWWRKLCLFSTFFLAKFGSRVSREIWINIYPCIPTGVECRVYK